MPDSIETRYLFSSPQGDVPAEGEILHRAFQVAPFRSHPFLTLGDFFSAVRDFVLLDQGRPLTRVLAGLWGGDPGLRDIRRVLIRYEKYGSLYQIASVEILSSKGRATFAVSAALSAEAQSTLLHECNLLKRLRRQWDPPYVPRVFFQAPVSVERGGEKDTLFMALSEWLDGYHEWHLAPDEEAPEHILLWDTQKGNRRLSREKSGEVLRLSSKILALYYDPRTFRHVFPWHHAAGDFVVREAGGSVEVRLISARGYEPLRFPRRDQGPEPLRAAFCYLLFLTVKMRLDRAEGMGKPLWAHASVLNAVVKGFFEGLDAKEAAGNLDAFPTGDLLRLAKGTGSEALERELRAQMHRYRHRDPVDVDAVRDRLGRHARDLDRALRALGP